MYNWSVDEKRFKKENIDPYAKRAIEFLLWGKVHSLPNNLTFWSLHKHKLPICCRSFFASELDEKTS